MYVYAKIYWSEDVFSESEYQSSKEVSFSLINLLWIIQDPDWRMKKLLICKSSRVSQPVSPSLYWVTLSIASSLLDLLRTNWPHELLWRCRVQILPWHRLLLLENRPGHRPRRYHQVANDERCLVWKLTWIGIRSRFKSQWNESLNFSTMRVSCNQTFRFLVFSFIRVHVSLLWGENNIG